MGGGSDQLSNSGSIVATGDVRRSTWVRATTRLWLYNGPNSKVEGKILLGTGNDLVFEDRNAAASTSMAATVTTRSTWTR